MYEYYKSTKLDKHIGKIKKETYSMLLEIDSSLEAMQNKEYSKSENWRANWNEIYNIRDNVFVTLENIKSSKLSNKSSKKLEDYSIIQADSTKLSEMVSYAGEQINELEKRVNAEKLTELQDYTKQIADFSGINDETSILNAKIAKNTARSYLNDVLAKLESNLPDYAPNGKLLSAKKWKIKNGVKKINIKAKQKKWLSENFEIECKYSKKLPSNDELQKYAGTLKPNKEAKVICYVTDEIDSHTKRIIENFEHSAMSVFCYETKTNNLVYNKKSEPTSYFLGYFDPKQKPKSIWDVLKEKAVGNKLGIDLINSLKLNDVSLELSGKFYRISPKEFGIMEG